MVDLCQPLLYCVQVVKPEPRVEPCTELFGPPLETVQYIVFGWLDLSAHPAWYDASLGPMLSPASAPTEFSQFGVPCSPMLACTDKASLTWRKNKIGRRGSFARHLSRTFSEQRRQMATWGPRSGLGPWRKVTEAVISSADGLSDSPSC